IVTVPWDPATVSGRTIPGRGRPPPARSRSDPGEDALLRRVGQPGGEEPDEHEHLAQSDQPVTGRCEDRRPWEEEHRVHRENDIEVGENVIAHMRVGPALP